MKVLSCSNPPSLRFTEVINANLGSVEFIKPAWNHLLDAAMSYAYKSGLSIDQTKEIAGATLESGKQPYKQFRPVPESPWFVLNMGADEAFKQTYRMLSHLRLPLRIHIRWKKNEGAAHPGDEGLFEFTPIARPQT